MKRRYAGALIGALVAGSISMAAAPAQAQTCTLGPVPQEELISTAGPIQVYAGRVPGYAVVVANWGTSYASCVAMAQVRCVQAVGPQLPLVEVDLATLTVTIYDDNIIGDARCLVGDPGH